MILQRMINLLIKIHNFLKMIHLLIKTHEFTKNDKFANKMYDFTKNKFTNKQHMILQEENANKKWQGVISGGTKSAGLQ